MFPPHRLMAKPLLLLLLVLISTSAGQSQEQDILLKLKSHWNNPPSLSNWTTSTPHCNWYGVNCNISTNSVINITLREQSPAISGDIPSFICELTDLAVFDVYDNNFTGTFPDLSLCRSLQQLNLGYNQIGGILPEDIGTVLSPDLVVFNVRGNNFTGKIPNSIGKMVRLNELRLDNNLFNGSIPVEISNITGLKVLTLATNPNFVPGPIPVEFGNLTKLTYLWIMQANLIGGIPAEFEKLVNLEYLDLKENNLTGTIPDWIWGFPNLQYIYIGENNFTGELPSSIGAKGLVNIDVSTNKLTGSIPEDFGRLPNLTVLTMFYNSFSGTIPAGLGNSTRLWDLRLFGNKLTGVIPPELGKYTKLFNFEVFQNNLTGELPRDLCAGGILNSLNVYENNLNGTVPGSLGNCPHLVDIKLNQNSFSGEFPASIWTLKNLTIVMTDDNNLSGELPDELPWNLTRLEIQNNKFSGKIPTKASSLTVFRGGGNEFSGDLPGDMNELPNLQDLSLNQNKLSGPIPSSTGNLQHLTNLNLSSNFLTGEIPTSIGSLPVLTTLDLSNNHLSGEIPQTIGNLKLNYLNLSSNALTGEVPQQLENAAYDQSFLSNPGLCSANPTLTGVPSCNSRSKKHDLPKGLLIFFLVLGILVFLTVTAFAAFAIRDFRRKRPTGDDISKWNLTPFHSLDFTESNILNGLTPQNLVGSGGSGQIYRIILPNHEEENLTVAVKKIGNSKKLDSKLEQQFQSEIEILGSIRHLNIIKLLCCVSSPDSKLLVYEYMKNGSLHDWLHGRGRPMGSGRRGSGLDWPTRLSIAVGAAKGLTYMHHECNPPVVHRDMKSSNILLDSDFRAKVADFGLARILVKLGEPDLVSNFAGSFGYMAPECGYTTKVTEKVDVYSFGVILLELTTGRQASGGGGNNSLAEWAWQRFQDGGSVSEILDEDLRNPIWLEEIAAVFRLGLICTGKQPSTRPTIKDVLQVLLTCSGGKYLVDDNDDRSEYAAIPPLLKKGTRRSKRQVNEEDEDNGLLCSV